MSDIFSRFAHWTARQSGRASTFMLAIGVVVVWAITGPMFDFSENWQLVINTGTTIVTFLMVFLIQNTQNRDTEAIQLKLDELIRATAEARNTMISLESLSEKDLDAIKASFAELSDEDEPQEQPAAGRREKHSGRAARRRQPVANDPR